MALTGTFERTLDDKLRLAIPKPLREGLGEADGSELYLAPGNEGCLSLYSPTGFDLLARTFEDATPGRAEVRNYQRLFYSQAERVTPDKQSRILIPERLKLRAGLTHDVLLIGVRDHVEIWDKLRWESFLSQHEHQFDELTTQALDAGVNG